MGAALGVSRPTPRRGTDRDAYQHQSPDQHQSSTVNTSTVADRQEQPLIEATIASIFDPAY